MIVKVREIFPHLEGHPPADQFFRHGTSVCMDSKENGDFLGRNPVFHAFFDLIHYILCFLIGVFYLLYMKKLPFLPHSSDLFIKPFCIISNNFERVADDIGSRTIIHIQKDPL